MMVLKEKVRQQAQKWPWQQSRSRNCSGTCLRLFCGRSAKTCHTTILQVFAQQMQDAQCMHASTCALVGGTLVHTHNHHRHQVDSVPHALRASESGQGTWAIGLRKEGNVPVPLEQVALGSCGCAQPARVDSA
jgi:hypothetical protein